MLPIALRLLASASVAALVVLLVFPKRALVLVGAHLVRILVLVVHGFPHIHLLFFVGRTLLWLSLSLAVGVGRLLFMVEPFELLLVG